MKIMIAICFMLISIMIYGCSESSSYSCNYESRHTGCGGKTWTSWEKGCYAFNIDDYKEGWTPEKVCGKFSGSDTECGGGCCIYTEYRDNEISRGGC